MAYVGKDNWLYMLLREKFKNNSFYVAFKGDIEMYYVYTKYDLEHEFYDCFICRCTYGKQSNHIEVIPPAFSLNQLGINWEQIEFYRIILEE
jgi:hypothetical protein